MSGDLSVVNIMSALATMTVIAVIGWLLIALRVLPPHAQQVIARVVFTVATPALLITTIGEADLDLLLTSTAEATLVSTSVLVVIAVVIFAWGGRRRPGEVVVATLSATYINAGNLGIAVALYVLADALTVVPTMLMQLLILAPIAFAVVETSGLNRRQALLRPLRSPLTISALIGLTLAIVPWSLPAPVLQPLELLAATAPPLALLTLGMSFAHSGRGSGPGTVQAPGTVEAVAARTHWATVAIVATVRAVIHPALAFGAATWFDVTDEGLLAVMLMASLPTAQNVLVYALQFGHGERIARDSQLITTIISLPLMVAVVALFH